MIVCLCHNVSTGDIAQEASGCCSFESLQERLQVGTGCGACVPCARETFHELKGNQGISATDRPPRGSQARAAAHA